MTRPSLANLLPVAVAALGAAALAGCGSDDPVSPQEQPESRWEWSLTPELDPVGYWTGPDGRFWIADSFGRVATYEDRGWAASETGCPHMLVSIWGPSADDLFVVGREGTILRGDGRTWSRFPSPSYQSLNSIHGTSVDDIYVSGFEVLFHFDGESWTVADTGATSHPGKVFAFAPDEVYLACRDYTVRRFDGTTWQEDAQLSSWNVYDFFETPSGLVAVGNRGVFRQEDGGWVDLDFPRPYSFPRGGLVLPDGSLVLIAPMSIMYLGPEGWTEETLDGIPLAPFLGPGGGLRVATIDGTVLAQVGQEWLLETPGVRADLEAVWGFSDRDVWAVGDDGLILHFDGSAWAEVPSGVDQNLTAVWGAAPDDVFAAATWGIILHFDGSQWSRQADLDTWLDDLWGSSGSHVLAAGEFAHWYDGSAWTRDESFPGDLIHGIWGTGPEDVFMVGEFQPLWHYDGDRWSPQDANATVDIDLYGVWGDRPDRMQALGRPGFNCYFYDGQTWQEEPIISAGTPFGMHGRAWDDVYAVGWEGEVMHFDGSAWRRMHKDLFTYWNYYDVWCSPTGAAYAVGSWGSVGVCRP